MIYQFFCQLEKLLTRNSNHSLTKRVEKIEFRMHRRDGLEMLEELKRYASDRQTPMPKWKLDVRKTIWLSFVALYKNSGIFYQFRNNTELKDALAEWLNP